MKRSLVLLLAPVLVAGCRNSPQAIDPFLPRTTVPPPATGAAVGGPAPYYPGATAAPAALPGSPYDPPGGNYSYPAGSAPAGSPATPPPSPQPTDRWPMSRHDDGTKQSSNATPIRSRLAGDAGVVRDSEVKFASAEMDAAPAAGTKSAANEVKIVRVGGSTATSFSSSSDEQEPRRLPQEDKPVDIMDLPPARQSAPGQQASRKVDLDSEDEPLASSQSPSTADRYSYDPNYRWLKGQLEYSLVDRRWKLRYIPIDGETDSYGGSVVLEGQVPAEFQPGDFVILRGSLASDAAPGHFAPGFHFETMDREAD